MKGLRRLLLGGLWLAACRPPATSADPEQPETTTEQPPEPQAPGSSEPTESPGEPPMRLTEIIPGIYAMLQPAARRLVDSNAVVVVTDVGTAVIDAPVRLRATQWLGETIEAMSPSPRRVLVTTHWHLDHTLGLARLRADFEAAGHAVEHWGHFALDPLLTTEGTGQLEERRVALADAQSQLEAMQHAGTHADGTPLRADERTQLAEQLEPLRAETLAMDGATLPLPTHHVEEPTTMMLGDFTLELVPVRAHTDADVVIHIHEASVLVAGDVVDEIPFGGHGYPRRWLSALQWIQGLEVAIIIPGHGPVMGPEHVDRLIALWEAVIEQARRANERGQTAAERYAQWQQTPQHRALRRTLATDPVAERSFDAFIPEALDRAMADLRGELKRPYP